jgi:hypothetical protein
LAYFVVDIHHFKAWFCLPFSDGEIHQVKIRPLSGKRHISGY